MTASRKAASHQSCSRHSCRHSSCPSLHSSLHAGSHTFSSALRQPPACCPSSLQARRRHEKPSSSGLSLSCSRACIPAGSLMQCLIM